MMRRLALFLLVVAGLGLGGVAAKAYWDAAVTSGAAGRSIGASVNAAVVPTASRISTDTVVLTWPAVVLSNGVAVDGYVVKRYDAATLVTQTVLGTCAGTVPATSCTETGVPVGSWRYSVYPRIGTSWTGTESPLTDPVAVSTPVLTLAKTYYNAPAVTTGTVTGFGVNEAISYRLDAATPLTGFPAVVDTTGGAPISSLSIPAMSEGVHTVHVIGANGSAVSTTVTYDTTVPLISSSAAPAPNAAGWNNTSPVTLTLTATDALAGVDRVRYTLDGTDPATSGTALTYTTPFTVAATATVRYHATDRAGNASAPGSRTVKVDTVAPADVLTLTGATGAVLQSGTIYYRGTAPGSFTITNAVTDAGSGPVSSATSALGGTTAGFTHSPSTVSTPAGGPYVSAAFSWTGGTSSAPTVTVTSTDAADNTKATALTLVNDSAAPTGVTVDAAGLTGTGGRYSTSTTVSIATSKGTDAGVGPATGAVLQRASATLANGSCGAWTGYSAVTTDPAVPYATTVADQACYRYQYVVADLLGNSVTQTSGDIKVDTTAPSAPVLGYSALTNTYGDGTTVYYRGSQSSGSFTVTAASTDSASGISGYTFPALGTNWISAPGGTGVNTYSWTTGPPAASTQPVTATNNAFLTAATPLTVTNDSVPPTGSAPTYPSGYVTEAKVTVAIPAGSDALSGLNAAATQVQRQSAPMTGAACGTYGGYTTTLNVGAVSSYDDSSVQKGTCNQYRIVYYDRVGNSQTYTASTVVKVPRYLTCFEAVTAHNPDIYYQWTDTTGTVAPDSSGRNPSRPGAYNGTVTNRGVPGACNTGSITLTGSAQGYVSNALAVNNPTNYTEEVWFRTAVANSTTKGRLLGLGSSQTGGSVIYDRHLYLNADGTLTFGTATDLLLIFSNREYLTTTTKYNDGQWHHAVVTQSAAAGMTLYVDGVAKANTVKVAQNYTGYWRVGWDNMAGWTGMSNADYFAGSLSNAAFYSTTVLNADQVHDHYIAGTVSSGGLLTAPSFTASAEATAFSARRFAATMSAAASASATAGPQSPSPSPVPSATTGWGSPSPSPQPTTPQPTTPSPAASSSADPGLCPGRPEPCAPDGSEPGPQTSTG